MQEISPQNLDVVNGAGWAEALGYAIGYMLGKSSIGEVDLQGALAQGA